MPPGGGTNGLVSWLDQSGLPRLGSLVDWETSLSEIRRDAYLPRSGCAQSPGGCRLGLQAEVLSLRSGLVYGAVFVQRGKRVPALREHEGTRALLFAQDLTGSFFYLAEDGRVLRVGPPDMRSLSVVAESPWVHLERGILDALRQRAPVVLRCEGDVSGPLSERLGLPVLDEAADALRQPRGDARLLVEARSPAFTDVAVLALDAAPALLGALRDIHARAFVAGPEPTLALEPLAAAPQLEVPATDSVPLWAPGAIRGWLSREGETLVQVTGRALSGGPVGGDSAPPSGGSPRVIVTRRREVGVGGATERRFSRLGEADLARFSPRARAYLLAAEVRRDPVDVPAAGELQAILARWGLPCYPALLEADAAWGGLAWGGEPSSRLGTFVMLAAHFPEPHAPLPARVPGSPRDLGLDWEGRQLTAIGSTASTMMYLDHDGSVVEYEMNDDVLFPSAGSLLFRIEAEAMLETATGQLGQYLEGALAGSVGAEVAGRLGLAPVPEASCGVRLWWTGEHVSVNELFSPVSGERITAILADTQEHLDRAMGRRA